MRQVSRVARVVTVGVVAGVVVGGSALPSASATTALATGGAKSAAPTRVDQTYRDGAGVVHYAFQPSGLPGARAVRQTGRAIRSGSCAFSGSGTGRADRTGPKVTVMTETTFDARTCTRELAVATYSRALAPASVVGKLDASPTATTSGAAAGTRGPLAPAVTRYIGSLKVNVEDPAQIDVTSTKSRVEWSGRSCVSSSYHNAYWHWFSGSGWRRTNAHWSYGRNCRRAYTNTYGKYRNGVFCVTIDTYTEHKQTRFDGRPRGGWHWAYHVDKWGGCNGLLHYEHIVETP